MPSSNQINCAIVGAEKSGKTTFINRHVTGQFQNTHLGDVVQLIYNTNNGPYIFNITESISLPQNNPDVLLVFFDTQDMSSFMKARELVLNGRQVFGKDLPIILCGNKSDIVHNYPKQMLEKIETLRLQQHIVIFMVSAKSNYNYDKPFISAIRRHTKNNNITLTDKILPEEVMSFFSGEDLQDLDTAMNNSINFNS